MLLLPEMANDSTTYRTEEDEKGSGIATVSKYCYIAASRTNPLVSNKGSTTAARKTTSFIHFPLDTKNTKMSLGPKEFLSLPDAVDESGMLMKRDTLISEAGMSNTSELNSDEVAYRSCNPCQLPLFEIKITMQTLMVRRLSEFIKIIPSEPSQAPNKDDPTNLMHNIMSTEQANRLKVQRLPFKSTSLCGAKKQNIEKLGENLTPMQFRYYKQMYEIKMNYLCHAMKMKPIYMQYLALSRENMTFTTCEPFTIRLRQIMSMSKSFSRDSSVPLGTIFRTINS